MEVCGHNIKQDEIIGIGPLMMERSGDLAMSTLYNSQRLVFMLHCKNTSIKIESRFFNVVTLDKTAYSKILDERKEYAEFKAQYEDARNRITSQWL